MSKNYVVKIKELSDQNKMRRGNIKYKIINFMLTLQRFNKPKELFPNFEKKKQKYPDKKKKRKP